MEPVPDQSRSPDTRRTTTDLVPIWNIDRPRPATFNHSHKAKSLTHTVLAILAALLATATLTACSATSTPNPKAPIIARMLLTTMVAAAFLIIASCSPENPQPATEPPSLKNEPKLPAQQAPIPSADSLTPRTTPFGIIPDWPRHYTDSPAATTVRWYEGPECPSGNYNIFDRTYHMSRDGHEGQANAFAHPDGYICMSEKFNLNTPDHTHLHELAHAILHYSGDITHAHTDRYTALASNLYRIDRAKRTLAQYGQRYCPEQQTIPTETAPCTEIHRLEHELKQLLLQQASLYSGPRPSVNRPDPTPTPTRPPPTPTPTSLPLTTHADAKNGFSIKFPSEWKTRSNKEKTELAKRNIRVNKFLAYPGQTRRDLLLVMTVPVPKTDYLADNKHHS